MKCKRKEINIPASSCQKKKIHESDVLLRFYSRVCYKNKSYRSKGQCKSFEQNKKSKNENNSNVVGKETVAFIIYYTSFR